MFVLSNMLATDARNAPPALASLRMFIAIAPAVEIWYGITNGVALFDGCADNAIRLDAGAAPSVIAVVTAMIQPWPLTRVKCPGDACWWDQGAVTGQMLPQGSIS